MPYPSAGHRSPESDPAERGEYHPQFFIESALL